MQRDVRLAEQIEPADRLGAIEAVTAELTAFLDLVRQLGDEDWERPTGNAGLTVRGVLATVTGQYQELANLGLFISRMRASSRRYPDRFWLDAHNQLQIDELGRVSPHLLIADLVRQGPAVARMLRGLPGPVRRLPISKFLPGLPLPEDRLRYLHDVLLARDTWIKRLDIAQATAREFVIDDHDRGIVSQVVRDLGRQWSGPPTTLDLSGPAGGMWIVGQPPPQASMQVDAVLLMRQLAGRADLSRTADGDDATAALSRALILF